MRSTHLSAATLAAILAGTPVLAQTDTAPRVTPPATAGVEMGTEVETAVQPENPLYALRAEQLRGQTILGAGGDEIGEVERVVLDKLGNAFAVVGVGGFLGLGERDVAIPLGQLMPHPDDRLATRLTREQVGSMAEFDPATNYLPVDGDSVISEAASREATSG